MDINYDSLLNKFGLSSFMTYNDKDSYSFPVHLFKMYTPKIYAPSATKELDELYRIREIVLLHETTGLRANYSVSESYLGDSDNYSIIKCFIIDKTNQHIDVTDIDIDNNQFITDKGPIKIENIRKHYIDND